MDFYQPDNWIIVKITHTTGSVYKVLAGWNGGYLYGSSWRMNSGIVRAEFDGQYYTFYGNSGSEYRCFKDSEGLRMNIAQIFHNLVTRGAEQNITVEQVSVESLPMLENVSGENHGE